MPVVGRSRRSFLLGGRVKLKFKKKTFEGLFHQEIQKDEIKMV